MSMKDPDTYPSRSVINWLHRITAPQIRIRKKYLQIRNNVCRPLRQMALVIPFPPTGSSKLASRLKEVAAAEGMRADLTALLTLCKKTDNDIRSCLSSLQFFRKRGRVLHSADVADLAVGSKDSAKSLFSVWDDVFTVPRLEDAQRERGACRNNPASAHAIRFKQVLDSVASCGEYDRLITGQFSHLC